MKKVISLILSIVLALSLCVQTFALDKLTKTNDYPVILVPGYSSSALKMINEDGSETQVWGINMDDIMNRIKKNIGGLFDGAGKWLGGDNGKQIASIVGNQMVDMLGVLACNPDGSSKNNIVPIIENTAEACRLTNMPEQYQSERDVMKYIQEYVSDDDIYNFNCDFRMGAVENATRLNDLILDIMAKTGCEKVNILCISHGGQITGTFLSMYGTNGYVNDVVMCMPAMGGAALAYDILTNSVEFDEENLMEFVEYGCQFETDYHWLLSANQLLFLDGFLKNADPYILQVIGYFGSIWDFIPYEYYKECINMLDPVESADLIAQTTYFHENIMKNYHENLQAAVDAGVNISILSGTGHSSVTGLKENSDAIITVNGTTGASCAPFGQRFNDGYVCKGTTCSDSSHNHLSPSMEIDASTAWLPDNTWYVDGLYHGMELFDEYTMGFVVKQLLSEEPMTDVYSDEAYPQFHAATSHSQTVHAQFNMSKEGYVSSEDNALIITNTTASSKVRILSVEAKGIDIHFTNIPIRSIAAGESVTIKFSGSIPKESLTRAAVTFTYSAAGSLTPIASRTLDFTVMNGDAPEFDSDNPYVNVDFKPSILTDSDEELSETLNKTGIADVLDIFYKFIKKLIKFVKQIADIIASVA